MNKNILLIMALVMALFLGACGNEQSSNNDANNNQSSNNEASGGKVQWSMGTSSSGSSPYVLGGAITQLINEKSSMITLSPQVTGGFEENLSLVSNGSVSIAQATLDQLNYAYAGKDRYEGKAKEEYRALFNASLMPVHVAVLANSDIQTYEDLAGQRFNIAAPQQSSHTLALNYLEAIGLTQDDIKAGLLSTKDAPGALSDNQQDGIFVVSSLPLPGLVEIAVSKPIRLLPIEGEIADRYVDILEGAVVKTTIPAGTYNGQDEDVPTVASPITLYVHKDASEEEIYEFTKVFWDNLEQFHADFPSSSNLTKDLALEGIQVPLHPGAEKYFKEQGMID
jgi:uncharacterized protein